MPRKVSIQDRVIEFVMTAPTSEVRTTLQLAQAVFQNRMKIPPLQAMGDNQELQRRKPGPKPRTVVVGQAASAPATSDGAIDPGGSTPRDVKEFLDAVANQNL